MNEAHAIPAPAREEDRYDPTFLRLSAGTVYFFFGFLKFYTDLSPAEVLASQTVMKMSFHIFDAEMALYLLALMECGIGLCFLFNFGMRWMFFVFLGHQAATFMPLFIYPELCFKIAPFEVMVPPDGQPVVAEVQSKRHAPVQEFVAAQLADTARRNPRALAQNDRHVRVATERLGPHV